MIHRPLPCQECGLPSLTVIDFVSLNSTQNLLVIFDKKLDTVLEETCEVGGQDGEDGTSTRFNYKVCYIMLMRTPLNQGYLLVDKG